MAGAPDLADAASNSAPSGITRTPVQAHPPQPSPASGRGECTECARPHYASSTNKHALGRADRKIIRRGASRSRIRKVPPFMIVVCKSLFAHGRNQHVSPAPLFGADGGTRGVTRGIEAVETGAHVDGVVGTALRERGGARPIGGRRVEGRRRRGRRPYQREIDGGPARMPRP